MQSDAEILRELGRRLRAAREGGGLSVTAAATAAKMSRRHLTEAEAGRANLTFLALVRLSQALGSSLTDLVDLSLPPRGAERIALFGLRGAGKTSVGRRLALTLEVPFVELDARVEELAGLQLAELFDLQGGATFARLEAEALEQVLASGRRMVIATGGSVVTRAAAFDRLLRSARTVWLTASPTEHFQRVLDQGDRRPMRDRPRAMDELQAILDERKALYSRCELAVATSGRDVGTVVAEILERLEMGR